MTIGPGLAKLPLLVAIATGGPALAGAWWPAGASWLQPVCVSAASQHHVAVVVEHADGSVVARCVPFVGATANGKQILDSSGIEHGYSDPNFGDEVCQIDYEPTSYPPECFKNLPNYWSLWEARYGQGWGYAKTGVDAISLSDGDALGFRYVPQSSPAPPGSAGGICPAPAPTSPPTAPAQPPTANPAPSSGAGLGSGPRGPTQPRAINDRPAIPQDTGGAPAPTSSNDHSRASPGAGTVTTASGAGVIAANHPGAAHPAPLTPPLGGWMVALVGGAVLIALLLVQVVVPRLRA